MCVSISKGERKVGKHSADGWPTVAGRSLRFSAAMFPAASLLPLMLLAGLSSESTATQHDNSTGKTYFIVFPENVASYHPTSPKNQIYVTALHNDTQVTIIQPNYDTLNENMQAAESRNVNVDPRMELGKERISDKTLEVTSTKEITIQVMSYRNSSIQTALVISSDKLAKKYLIPPIPQIEGSTEPASIVTTLVTERAPFKLIIVNGDQDNKVTAKSEQKSEDITLKPKQVAQIWVQEDDAWRVVEATQPVAVLFGHPCVIQSQCNCGLLYTMLSPARDETLKFFVPSTFPWDTSGETKILLSETGSAQVKTFNPDSPLIQVAGSAILYHPKLLLTLIPESDFACCYVVTPIRGMQNYAVIVVHKDKTEGVHVGKDPHQGTDWTALKGTVYVSTKIPLQQTGTPPLTTIIWHASSKMAVYFLGHDSKTMFGNPAPVISKSPDYRGCVLNPGVMEIGDDASGWRESLKYCRDKNMEMICLSDAEAQPQAARRLSELNNGNLQEVWIGMRESSLSGQYYWVNEDPVKSTNWQNDEPSIETSHKCVLMKAKSDEDFSWRSEDCCKAYHPVCYTEAEFLEKRDI